MSSEPSDSVCGSPLNPVYHESLDQYDSDTWYEEDGTPRCSRDVWDGTDTDRCIWHADVENKPVARLIAARSDGPERLDNAFLVGVELGDEISFAGCRLVKANLRHADLHRADLSGAVLEEADFTEASLGGANFTGANLSNSLLTDADLSNSCLTDADLWNATATGVDLMCADLSEADMSGIDLTGASLPESNLDDTVLQSSELVGVVLQDAYLLGADLQSADLTGANLGGADLSNSDLTDATFAEVKLSNTRFKDVEVDHNTFFGTYSKHEIEADDAATDESWLATHISARLRALGRPSTNPVPIEQAEIQYRTIQRLRREHDLHQRSDLEIREKHAYRKRALAERRYWDWFKLATYRWPMGSGERPMHVIGTSLVVMLACAAVYPLLGGFQRTDTPTMPVADFSIKAAGVLPPSLEPYISSLYFSIVTFTTVGYGDLQPANHVVQLVASLEGFIGTVLMVFLGFVLANRGA